MREKGLPCINYFVLTGRQNNPFLHSAKLDLDIDRFLP